MREFNPVLVKELRGRMRGARAFVLLSIYLIILSAVTLLLYVALAADAGSDLNAGQRIGKALFLVIAAVALIEVCVITPALTAGSIAGEKERQTYDLLISSLLSPWQIVWGKLGAALAFALLMVISVVPVMSLAFIFGGVSLAEVLIALAGLIATSIFYATIGLFWSSVMRSSLGATSFSLGTIILILLGIPFLAAIVMIFTNAGSDALWLRSAAFIYVGGAILSAHPFIALGLTEAQIIEGQNVFFSTINIAPNQSIIVPGPWIVYIFLSAIFSALMIVLSVRMLRPVQYESARQEPRRQSEA